MKSCCFVSLLSDSKARVYLWSLVISASLISCVYFAGSAFFAREYRVISGFGINTTQRHGFGINTTQRHGFGINTTQRHGFGINTAQRHGFGINTTQRHGFGINTTQRHAQPDKCEGKCKPLGSEALPEGIVCKTSNLEMRPLFGDVDKKNSLKGSVNLLAIPVGIKQKELVSKIVQKFLENSFVVILFHYDAIVDQWNDLEWSSRVIHVSAANQTKWWFAKRFLHPDIVSEYEYIFLWDEDLGVENFHPGRYVSIIKAEGLEISQPALDPVKSRVHQQITIRRKNSRVHRRYYKLTGGGRCYHNSTAPPCVGWVEMMAPVFSRAAWRCVWYMIQNDLIHAWGLDRQLGYCAQGDRTAKVGVVDKEYIVHIGLPTLGAVSGGNKLADESADDSSPTEKLADSETMATSVPNKFDNRSAVTKQSYIEMRTFEKRWSNAVKKDKCWVDPYLDTIKPDVH